MTVSEAHPEAINHRADAYIFDRGTSTISSSSTGGGHLIDFTCTNAAKSTGQNGAAPGSHADAEEIRKYAQYKREFPDFSADSLPALIIIAMERHGSWSKGTRDYWATCVHAAHQRQKDLRVPRPPISTDTTGTPDTGCRPDARQREPHPPVPPPGP